MRCSPRALLPLLAALLQAGTSAADVIEIEFDFGGSSISAAGGFINIPPDGTITAASARVRVPGTGVATPLPGAGRMSAFTLGVTVDAMTFGITLTGSAQVTQNGTAPGTLTAGLGVLKLTQPFYMQATGAFDCLGSTGACALFGTFPTTFNGPQTILPPSQLSVAGLATPGAATAQGIIPISLGGQTAVLLLSGSEVSRTFVPEPTRMVQLAVALAALAGLAAWRRRF